MERIQLQTKSSQAKTKAPSMLQTWEEALSDLEESEREFERGEVVSAEEFDLSCRALLDSFAISYAH